MGFKNPIRTLGDYSKPSYEGYRNTIELSAGNNVVPLRSETIWTTRLYNDILMFQQHHGESLSEAWTHFKDLLQKVPHHDIDRWLQIQKIYDHVSFHLKCDINCAAGGKLRNKNTNESWEIIENLALYDHKGWDETKEFVYPVKAISTPQGIPKTPDWRLLELKDHINFLQKGLRPTPTSTIIHTPQAYVNAVQLNSRPQNQKELPKLKTFGFCERTCPSPQPQALETTFEARVRDYMAAYTKRIEIFENTIFKQRKEINGRTNEMFGLLKELTTSRTPEKVMMREESKFLVTKNVNFISLARNEDEENNQTDETPDNTKMPTKTKMPVRKAKAINGSKNGIENESIKRPENDEAVEGSGFNNSWSGTRVKKKKGKEYKILPGGPAYDAILKKKITMKEDIVVAEHVYPIEFVGLDIKENEKRHFILGTPFLTTAKALIKFDTGTITLRSGKSKVSFHWIPDSSCVNDKGVKNDIEPIAPTMTFNRLVLEWDEKIKLYLEREMQFNQWRSKIFKSKHPLSLQSRKEWMMKEKSRKNV
ncbi:hypothetical protein Tco_0585611 [Tanacetum coccineum]